MPPLRFRHPDLLSRIKSADVYEHLLHAARAQAGAVSAEGAVGAVRGLLTAALAAETGRPVVAVAADLESARELAEEAATFLPPGAVRLLPDRDLAPYESGPVSPQIAGLRLEALPALPQLADGLVVTTALAWQEALPSPARLARADLAVGLADALEREDLLHRLVAGGYRRVDVVELAGDFAARGGVVDVFAPAAGRPARIEFDGDLVASLRWFDASTQRSQEEVDRVRFGPATEALLTDEERLAILGRLPDPLERRGGQRVARLRERLETGGSMEGEERYLPWLLPDAVRLPAFLPPGVLAVLVEPSAVRQAWERSAARAKAIHEELARAHERVPEPAEVHGPAAEAAAAVDRLPQIRLLEFSAADGRPAVSLGARPARFGAREFPAFERALAGWRASGHQVWLAAENPDEAEAVAARLPREDLPPRVVEGRWSGGAVAEALGAVLLPVRDVFGVAVRRAPVRRPPKAFRDAFADLKPGDPVVHEEYGIGLYRGVMPLDIEGVRQDFFLIEYADEEKLYLPADQAGRVQRYLGSGAAPVLSRLGTEAWERTKARVAAGLRLYAGELLKLYAERHVATARAFPTAPDPERAFAATFPYEETPDQTRVIGEVAKDLEGAKPMDRLVCGDVGYGKTEVLIRAAFRVALQGSQVAILVPTTILAQQHWQNLSARMAGTGVTVGMLSRFRSREERKAELAAQASGALDIVVGTHHLLSSSIVFKALGLLVIDEEHRFGVKQKERIKELKRNVHVLTLTATPIPRTLNMGLAGLRDLSVIETPPPGRLSVVTHVHEENPSVVREAIRRELARGGQVFYLHNRVQTIMTCAEKVRALVPEARFVVGHGQMPLGPLEKAMGAFTSGKADVLVSTSIIGAGLDLPNANTLIVERAETFGLADLYQLRGRVGRGSRQAYAYFFFSPKGAPTLDARRRLAALIEFGELGSGFRLAVRDLEIRGAGNLLGAEQHGALHAVGFDLYTRLLGSAIREMKGEVVTAEVPPSVSLGLEAFLPDPYVSDSRSKLEIYKRLSAAGTPAELAELTAELVDRFGPPPAPVERLLRQAGLRIAGAAAGVTRIERHGREATLTFRSRPELGAVLKGGTKPGWKVGERALTVPAPASPEGLLDLLAGLLAATPAPAPAAR